MNTIINTTIMLRSQNNTYGNDNECENTDGDPTQGNRCLGTV
jgi:hypothetical protein